MVRRLFQVIHVMLQELFNSHDYSFLKTFCGGATGTLPRKLRRYRVAIASNAGRADGPPTQDRRRAPLLEYSVLSLKLASYSMRPPRWVDGALELRMTRG